MLWSRRQCYMHQPYGHLVLLRICRKSLNKRAARVILGVDTKANSVQLFRKLDWVPFFHEAKVIGYGIQTSVWWLPFLYVSDADDKRWHQWKTKQTWTRFKRESEGGRSVTVLTTRPWNTIRMGYWPSLFGQDGWILAKFFFLRVYGPRRSRGP